MAVQAGVPVALRNGSTVFVRPVRADDLEPLAAFFDALDPESKRLRFFTAAADMHRAAAHAVQQADWLYGLLAVQGEDGRIVGHAEWVREDDAPVAEVAFETAAAMRGQGLATILLAHLAADAAARGITQFVAEVLPENHRMADVFRDSGFPVEVRPGIGELHMAFPTELTAEGRQAFEDRERIAAAAAVASVLAPASIVLVGASQHRRTTGGALLYHLLSGGYTGALHLVGTSSRSHIAGHRMLASVADVPTDIELAIVAGAEVDVVEVARECATKGVKALVVVSAGFGEDDAVDAARRHDLLEVCRRAGMRLVGPNCLGVVNTAEDVALYATFAPVIPVPGRVGFLTQSGGLGIAVLDHLDNWGVGVSSFVSVGDKADLSGNDVLQYWEDDPATELLVLYLQSFGNPRKFGRIARRIARRKPVVAIKAGGTRLGEPSGGSTTEWLLDVAEHSIDGLFGQAGVIRVDTLTELLGVTALLATQPRPPGDRVAIVTNAGGAAMVCADACAAAGLRVVAGYPEDVKAGASADVFGAAVRDALADPEADAVIAIFVPPLTTDAADAAAALHDACAVRTREVPLLSVFLSGGGGAAPAPVFRFPEDAARALSRAARYSLWRGEEDGTVELPEGLRMDEATAVLADGLAHGEAWLRPEETARLLDCYAIPRLPITAAADPAEAGRAAAAIGGPVSLKGVSPGLRARGEAGAVELGLQGWEGVEEAAAAMRERLAAQGHADVSFAVQPMAPPGVELLVGVAHDPRLGPVVVCGAGGAAGLLLRDVSVRLAPLTDADIQGMLRGLSTFPLLEGYRGSRGADLGAVEELLARVSAMVDTHPQIAALDLEPVIAAPEGVFVVDARVRVEAREVSREVPRLGTALAP